MKSPHLNHLIAIAHISLPAALFAADVDMDVTLGPRLWIRTGRAKSPR